MSSTEDNSNELLCKFIQWHKYEYSHIRSLIIQTELDIRLPETMAVHSYPCVKYLKDDVRFIRSKTMRKTIYTAIANLYLPTVYWHDVGSYLVIPAPNLKHEDLLNISNAKLGRYRSWECQSGTILYGGVICLILKYRDISMLKFNACILYATRKAGGVAFFLSIPPNPPRLGKL